MAVDLTIRFIIDRVTPTTVIRVTDASSGNSSISGILNVTYPNGFVYNNTNFASPDISAEGGTKDIPLEVNANNEPVTGLYTFTYQALVNGSTVTTESKTFNFTWDEPEPSITNTSDAVIPEVKFKDVTDYDVGDFSETYNSWTVSASTPSTSEVGSLTKTLAATTSSRELDVVEAGNYYEGSYTPQVSVNITYQSDSISYLSVTYIERFSRSFIVNEVPNQTELIGYIKTYKSQISEGEKETYDYAIALYSDIIERIQADNNDGTQALIDELLDILNISYGSSYSSSPMQPFYVTTRGLDGIVETNGDGTKYLANDGTYKEISNEAALQEAITASGLATRLGSIENGDTVALNTTFTEFAKLILQEFVYVDPTFTLGSTTPLNVEAGTNLSLTFTFDFTQNDAGALSEIRLYKGGVLEQTQASQTDYTETTYQIAEETITYNAQADYAQGALKAGDTVGDNRIAAGTITSNNRVYRGQRKVFYDAVANTSTINSSYIRALSGNDLNPQAGTTFTINIPAGTERVIFAYPATIQDVSSVESRETNFDVKSVFTKTTVNVAGANGFTLISYKVFTYEPAEPYSAEANYDVTI